MLFDPDRTLGRTIVLDRPFGRCIKHLVEINYRTLDILIDKRLRVNMGRVYVRRCNRTYRSTTVICTFVLIPHFIYASNAATYLRITGVNVPVPLLARML